VLYQIIFRSSATPNHIPLISNGELVDSSIVDDGSQVTIGQGGNGLVIRSDGLITHFAAGQSFPGTVSSVSSGDGSVSVIGGASSVPTISVNGISNGNVADGGLDPRKISGTAAVVDFSNTFSQGDQFVNGNVTVFAHQGQMLLGDVGCSGFAGIDMSNGPPCADFAFASTTVSNSSATETWINRPAGSQIHFRVANVDVMRIAADGEVFVSGMTKPAGAFKIDHPLDPANKYLYHSFVESPDMMNIYDGVVRLDGNGQAVIALPDWFGALNRDFRYQLAAIGAPGPNLYVAEEISDNRFKIGGGRPGGKVSWQVTGIRQDAYANAHRIPVEQDKPAAEKGTYLYPELFGSPQEKGLTVLSGPKLGAGK
jgi:hypothetical protein